MVFWNLLDVGRVIVEPSLCLSSPYKVVPLVLILIRSPLPASMDVNKVFTLPAEFGGVEEEITQLWLGPKEVVFEKNEESSQYLKPLYVQDHIDGRPIFRMLIDGGTAVNLMSYYVFKKLGREDVELMKINLTLNCVCVCVGGGGGQPDGAQRCHLHRAHHREQVSLPLSSLSRCKVIIVLFWIVIGFTPIVVCLLLYISF
jgi:hypothetical protein